jgi:hypothetical protein
MYLKEHIQEILVIYKVMNAYLLEEPTSKMYDTHA